MAQASIPSMYELNVAFFNDLHAIEYLKMHGVLETPTICLKCDKKANWQRLTYAIAQVEYR